MERGMEQAEKNFNVGSCHTNAQHINTLLRRAFDNLTAMDKCSAEKRFETLQQKLDEQSEVKNDIASEESARAEAEYGGRHFSPELASEGPDEEEELDFRSAAGDEEEAMNIEDQLKVVCDEKGERVVERVQADRVVECVSGDRHEEHRWAPRRDERELKRLIQEVQKKIEHVERALKTFPYRKKETSQKEDDQVLVL
ncbi:hypothetical protein OSTOST_04222 [Ostertagia ostertagi]